ncbi:MAG: phosphoesterase [Oscillospiraceae bacterium]
MKIKYDFHTHSCLSPCGDNDMTPSNLVNMSMLCGVEVLALTDHNTCLNCAAAMKVATAANMLFIPGMELTTSEEIHVVCLFPQLESAESFGEFVYKKLPDIKNRPEIFGDQLILNENDQLVGTIDKLLINATSIDIYSVVPLVESYGGFCLPAHIDKTSYSILSNLGFFPNDCGFTAAEISSKCDFDSLKSAHPEISDLMIFRDSDSHLLESLDFKSENINCREKTVFSVFEALRHA